MLVERLDLFDFKVTLTEAEFNAVKELTELNNKPIACTLLYIFGLGFDEVDIE